MSHLDSHSGFLSDFHVLKVYYPIEPSQRSQHPNAIIKEIAEGAKISGGPKNETL